MIYVTDTVGEVKLIYKPNKDFFRTMVTRSKVAVSFLRPLYDDDTICHHEEAIILYLNRANHIVAYYRLAVGGTAGCVIDVKLIA